ncbi:hypothetical protein BDR26DRAFT_895075 [Obelidium mucronatum]|nr:hypothetical protein BDR26DRAFT_895075 [Obelidium mucronatum]
MTSAAFVGLGSELSILLLGVCVASVGMFYWSKKRKQARAAQVTPLPQQQQDVIYSNQKNDDKVDNSNTTQTPIISKEQQSINTSVNLQNQPEYIDSSSSSSHVVTVAPEADLQQLTSTAESCSNTPAATVANVPATPVYAPSTTPVAFNTEGLTYAQKYRLSVQAPPPTRESNSVVHGSTFSTSATVISPSPNTTPLSSATATAAIGAEDPVLTYFQKYNLAISATNNTNVKPASKA